ncbi:MAG TPA: molecular chaperone DnaK suppressor DksA [Candidatus Paceibacterota bacterium]
MSKNASKKFEKTLLDEKRLLEKELSQIAKRNPSNPNDWMPTTGEADQSKADENVVADAFENLEYNIGVATRLENRLTDISDALDKIKNGTYGTCEKGKHPIEKDRLEANPAARTCKAHM